MRRPEPELHDLPPAKRAAITRAVIHAARGHLQAADANTALAYYRPDAVVVSDGRWYESFDDFAQDARAFYSTLREVHCAAWDKPRVDVLSDHAAVFTAEVRWASTDSAGLRTDLRGTWTAVWLRGPEGWRIAVRHESFLPTTDDPAAAT